MGALDRQTADNFDNNRNRINHSMDFSTMIVTMTLWIILLSMLCILMGIQMHTGVYAFNLQALIQKSMWIVIALQYSIMAFSYICYKRANDRANQTR